MNAQNTTRVNRIQNNAIDMYKRRMNGMVEHSNEEAIRSVDEENRE